MFFRTLLRLLIAVIVPLVILLFPLDNPTINDIGKHLIQDRIERTFRGTFSLIEEQLVKYPQAQWPKRMEELSQHFSYPISLIPLHSYPVEERIFQCLSDRDRFCLWDQNDVDAIHRVIGSSDWVIELYLEESKQEDIRRNITGTSELISRYFDTAKPEQWPQAIAAIQQRFGFPIIITHADQITLNAREKEQLIQTGTVSFQDDLDQAMILHQLPDNKPLLLLGPVPLSEANTAIAIKVIVMLLGSITIGLLLFVYVLCRDINKLKNVARQFGEGHLTQRSSIRKSAVMAPLSASFNNMADNIHKTITSQRELTNAIAHDLRTPLSRMSFALEMLDGEELKREEKTRYYQSMASSIDVIDYLIKQMLILARYTRAADISHFHKANFAKLLKEETVLFQQNHTHLTISLDIAPSLESEEILIDQRALTRALTNLVDNAIRYTQHKIFIELKLDKNDLILSVSDDGPGIPVSEREKVCEAFGQLNNQQRDKEKDSGHGLGLAIVKQIALWHQGSIAIDESTMGGAKISIRWPRK